MFGFPFPPRVLSFGERMSAAIVADALRAEVPGQGFLFFWRGGGAVEVQPGSQSGARPPAFFPAPNKAPVVDTDWCDARALIKTDNNYLSAQVRMRVVGTDSGPPWGALSRRRCFRHCCLTAADGSPPRLGNHVPSPLAVAPPPPFRGGGGWRHRSTCAPLSAGGLPEDKRSQPPVLRPLLRRGRRTGSGACGRLFGERMMRLRGHPPTHPGAARTSTGPFSLHTR